MADLHPKLNQHSPTDLFNVLLNSEFIWTDDLNNTHLERLPTLYRCSNSTMAVYDQENRTHAKDQGRVKDNITLTLPDIIHMVHGHDEHEADVVVNIAHIFHYLSIAILLIIMIEVSLDVCPLIDHVTFSPSILQKFSLSHNNPYFPCNIAITNFLVLHTCEIRFHDVIGQSTVHMYSYAKIPKYG